VTTDDRYAWWRLLASVLLATLGGIGIWANVIVLTEIQREFGVDRGGASLPYAATMLGFGVGGLLMGRLIDRYGAMWPMVASSIFLASGFVLASQVQSYWQFIAIQTLLIGMLGMAITFGPLVADISHSVTHSPLAVVWHDRTGGACLLRRDVDAAGAYCGLLQ